MPRLKALIFGAIGSIAETSDLQRQAFNRAFAGAGIDWHWDAATYRDLLAINGGQARLRAWRSASPARAGVSDAEIGALHAAKERHYGQLMAPGTVPPRAGVAALMAQCDRAGLPVALCTSTSRANVDAVARALGSALPFAQFAEVVTIDKISCVKPAPDAYLYCLRQLGVRADEVLAIEDTPVSISAAKAAGVFVVATPGATTADQDFSGADIVVRDLGAVSLEQLRALLHQKHHLSAA